VIPSAESCWSLIHDKKFKVSERYRAYSDIKLVGPSGLLWPWEDNIIRKKQAELVSSDDRK
jgi:hypothetical protein